jgi:hypothetical protein
MQPLHAGDEYVPGTHFLQTKQSLWDAVEVLLQEGKAMVHSQVEPRLEILTREFESEPNIDEETCTISSSVRAESQTRACAAAQSLGSLGFIASCQLPA